MRAQRKASFESSKRNKFLEGAEKEKHNSVQLDVVSISSIT